MWYLTQLPVIPLQLLLIRFLIQVCTLHNSRLCSPQVSHSK